MKQSATVDLMEPKEIVEHIRALLDFHDLLEHGWDYEWRQFSQQLLGVGWSKDRINRLLAAASYNTHYEAMIDSPIVR